MSLRLRLPSPRRGGGGTQTFNTNDALLKARMNLQEEAEPVGEIVARPVRVERDTKAEISNVDMNVGALFSMGVARRGTHAVVGGQNGTVAVVTLSSLYSGTPQIVNAKLPASGSGNQTVVVACSAHVETIAAYTTGATKVYVYSRALSLKTELVRAKPIHAVAVSSDGSKIAVGCASKQVSVYSISLVGQSLAVEYDVKELVFSHPTALSFSNAGKFLAMGGDMRKGCVWSTASRSTEPLRVFGRGGIINAIDFSKSDKWMAMGSSGDQLLTLIDTTSWEIHAEIPQSGDVTAVSFSADELAMGCVSNSVLKVINRASLETTHEIGGAGDFAGVKAHAGWTPDGTLIVMGTKKVFSFDYKTQRECVMPPRLTPNFNPRQTIALSAYGQHVAYSGSMTAPGESKPVQTLIVETVGYARAKPTFAFKFNAGLVKVAFSPDNTKLAALSAARLVIFNNDQNNGWKVRADLTLKSGAAAKTFMWSTNAKSIAVWLATTVVSLSADDLSQQDEREHGSAFSYDLASLGREFSGQGLGDDARIKTLAGPIVIALGGKRVQEAKLSPDGQTVAAGGNGVLALIDSKMMEATESREIKGWVMGLAWAPDSQTLAIGGHDKTVVVLNVLANVVVARCGERGYWPVALAFSHNCAMLVDGGFASDKQQLAVYSCDGSRLPLIEPVDSAPILRVERPSAMKRSDFDEKRREAVIDIVSNFPAIALNPLPSGELSLQPAAGGASRMADVLAHRTERSMLEELVDKIPALAVLPSAGRQHPTFTIALKQRDVRTLRVLLVAGAKAPIAARKILATKLIPAIVAMRMGSAVTAFLQQVALEESGAEIKSGCHRDGSPLVQDDVLELHPTHGGAGTSIWLGHHEDPSKLKTVLDARKGIEAGEEEAIESMGYLAGLLARARSALAAALTSARGYLPLEKPAALYTRAYNALASAIEKVPNDDVRVYLKGHVLVFVPQPDGEIAATRRRVGTEVQAMRVPIPGLSSRACLEGLCRIGLNGTFDNALMRPTVDCLWHNHFFFAHLVKSLLHALHVAALAVYIIEIGAGLRFYGAAERSERVLLAVGGICGMSVYIGFFELRQLLGSQLHHGLLSGSLMYALSFWNLGDLAVALVPLYAIALDAAGGEIDEGHVHVKGLLAGSAILMFMRTAQLLQGFELTGWLVMVLMQNVRDMVGFIVLVSMSIFFFSLAFLMLFVDAQQGTQGGYAKAWHSLMTTFTMGVFADFDVDSLDGENTLNSTMAKSLFIIFMLLVGVVSLNALIAFLGDSYAKVQDRQVEATLSLKARLIVEYYTAAGPFAQLTEKRVAWTHVLRIVKDDGAKSGEWAGQLTEIKREIEWFNKQLSADVHKQSRQMDELKTTVDRIAAAVGGAAKGQAAAGDDEDKPLEIGDSVVSGSGAHAHA